MVSLAQPCFIRSKVHNHCFSKLYSWLSKLIIFPYQTDSSSDFGQLHGFMVCSYPYPIDTYKAISFLEDFYNDFIAVGCIHRHVLSMGVLMSNEHKALMNSNLTNEPKEILQTNYIIN